MAVQFLPGRPSSPFTAAFEGKPFPTSSSVSLRSGAAHPPLPSPHASLLERPRQASPASLFSIASAPSPRNNENAPPISAGSLQRVLRPASSVDGFHKSGSAEIHRHPLTATSLSQRRPVIDKPSACPVEEIVTESHLGKDSIHSGSDFEDVNLSRSSATAKSAEEKSNRLRWHSKAKEKPQTIVQVKQQVQTQDERDQEVTTAHTRRIDLECSPSGAPSVPFHSPISHSERQSVDSSGFVHTVKTASFSGGSFSILSKSFGLGLSHDTQALLGSRSRFSTDSDRPATSASLDEGAIKRAIRRRQILEEIISTEQSYVTDLKALAYLMSTLLASTTSIPSRVRSAVYRNVVDLLHLHEGILNSLHHATFKAAARKWADTISPYKLGSPRHRRWHSVDQQGHGRFNRRRHRTGSSMDSVDIMRTRARLGAAESADVNDIVTIFKSSISGFFLYEEYCANHAVMADDLQKTMPNLWSTYSTGMESLGRMIVSLDQQHENNKKGMTVGDLLVKPIQRVCRYPLLFEELLRQTPVADCPSIRSEVDHVLHAFKEIAHSVNTASGSGEARLQIQRRWYLQSHLDFGQTGFSVADLRSLGNVRLCGVLYVTYQSNSQIDGAYSLCILYEHFFIIAMPVVGGSRFDVVAIIKLSDLKIESAGDGKGLQCPSAFHTWKICFTVDNNLYEFMLSACSAVEEDTWKTSLVGNSAKQPHSNLSSISFRSRVTLELKSLGLIYGQHGSVTRQPSVQRAATVCNRTSICPIIIRNTHNPEDLHELRQPTKPAVNRSQSHMTTNRIVVLAPKKSERTRLETMLSEVWTKDKLPYPGMIASRGGQIIRASAGSLVRKLSLASIQGSFSRRSASLTVSSKRSYETFSESRRSRERVPTFQIRRDSFTDKVAPKPQRKTAHDVPELDTMDSVVNRMIGDTLQLSNSSASSNDTIIKRKATLKKKTTIQVTPGSVGPNDSAQKFYASETDTDERKVKVEDELTGRKKRWSNPIGVLKDRAAGGLRHMLYSSK